MSALRISANQRASPSFWSLRPADDLWVAAARERARPRRNRSGPVLRFLNRSGPVPRFLNSKSLKSCRIFLMSRFFNARN